MSVSSGYKQQFGWREWPTILDAQDHLDFLTLRRCAGCLTRRRTRERFAGQAHPHG
jgi:hypothetical protein